MQFCTSVKYVYVCILFLEMFKKKRFFFFLKILECFKYHRVIYNRGSYYYYCYYYYPKGATTTSTMKISWLFTSLKIPKISCGEIIRYFHTIHIIICRTLYFGYWYILWTLWSLFLNLCHPLSPSLSYNISLSFTSPSLSHSLALSFSH